MRPALDTQVRYRCCGRSGYATATSEETLPGDRRAFGAVIVARASRRAGVIRSMADAGDRASIALLPIARRLEESASYVEALPDDFWTR